MGSTGYDIVVVGAGAAGAVVAARLAERGSGSILVLEAGPDLRAATPAEMRQGWRLTEIPDWGYKPEPETAGTTPRVRRGKVVGGTSWLTRFAVRGSTADFDAWAARGNPGWSFADVLPAFRRVETDAEFGGAAWHGDSGPLPITRYPNLSPSPLHQATIDGLSALGFPAVADHNQPGATGVGRMPMSLRDGARVTAMDAFLPGVTVRAGLTIQADALVSTVVVERGRATGVRLVDGSHIDASAVILCAGVYGSPAILLRSGIGSTAHLADVGIDTVVDLRGVGENLADHPSVIVDTGWRGGVAAPHILHTIATFSSSGRDPALAPDLLIWVEDPDGDEAEFGFAVVLMKPLTRGRVRLSSADPGLAPQIMLPGVREPADVERLAEGYEVGLELARRPEVQRATGGKLPQDPGDAAGRRRAVVENYYSIPHTVGTCRMGPSMANGDVVDSLGRVHGVDGLRVIDASIIPDATSGFPHLVTIMLADRLAEGFADG